MAGGLASDAQAQRSIVKGALDDSVGHARVSTDWYVARMHRGPASGRPQDRTLSGRPAKPGPSADRRGRATPSQRMGPGGRRKVVTSQTQPGNNPLIR